MAEDPTMDWLMPRPLRRMIGEADLIVIGPVACAPRFPATSRESWRNNFEAAIQPIEVLKGPAGAESPVRYSSMDGVFEPRRHPQGSEVLAFLKWQPCRWVVDSLSSGTRSIEGDGMREVYSDRIREMVEIHALPTYAERYPAIVEWIVRCCESPFTQSEGVEEFGDKVQEEHFKNRTQVKGLLGVLSESQRERLLVASVHSASLLDEEGASLARVLAPLHDPRMAEGIEEVLRAMASSPTPRPRPWMEALVEVLDWREGRQFLFETSFPPALPALCSERLATFLERLDGFRARPALRHA